ncbi:MAG: response regulator [candidate division Zixibacteria bacterium]
MNEMIQKLIDKRAGEPINILIVDDEESVRNVFVDFCKTSPLFNVDAASGGMEAIEKVKNTNYDIVTLDLVMPEISGLDAIENIKKSRPHLPIVIVTGNATEELIRQAGTMGGCRVLRKPVNLDDFIAELADLAIEKC